MASPPRNKEFNTFMMDFENSVLSDWDSRTRQHPVGRKRYLDPMWQSLVRANVSPHHSDVTWEQYVEWVAHGGGDDWFQDAH